MTYQNYDGTKTIEWKESKYKVQPFNSQEMIPSLETLLNIGSYKVFTYVMNLIEEIFT